MPLNTKKYIKKRIISEQISLNKFWKKICGNFFWLNFLKKAFQNKIGKKNLLKNSCLSLALRSHDQFQASHWSPSPYKKITPPPQYFFKTPSTKFVLNLIFF